MQSQQWTQVSWVDRRPLHQPLQTQTQTTQHAAHADMWAELRADIVAVKRKLDDFIVKMEDFARE